MSKPDYRQIIIDFLSDHPGSTGLQITQELERRSRAAKWFGVGSFWTALFGPGSGMAYVILAGLECDGIIVSWWGPATADRNGLRPRCYMLVMHEQDAEG